jgi:3-hydroxyacyl-CoA dehydrogenase/3a,7a,12a-trihydroxy-5b-cholest-24-enoyl-CoA hydratase
MKECVPVPTRKPDTQVEQKTREDQAVLYRQGSGDLNPLHVDASFAAIMGFKKPILHGLCSLGFSVRHVIDTFMGGDHTAFKAVKVRFSKPVIPGQTLVTEMWRGDNNRVHFQTRVKETGDLVITNAYVDFNRKLGAKMRADGKKNSGAELNSGAIFDAMGERISAEHVKKINAIFMWVITKNGKEATKWTVDLKSGNGKVYEGEPKDGAKPTTTLTLDDDDMVKLVGGQLNPQQAFMSGKLKIKGNIMLTQKLQTLFNDVKAKM